MGAADRMGFVPFQLPMLPSQLDRVRAVLRTSANQAGLSEPLADDAVIALERTRQVAHGDLACNLAMQLARREKQPPRAVAQKIVDQLGKGVAADLIERAEVAGPGFINLWLRAAVKQQTVRAIVDAAAGRSAVGDGDSSSAESRAFGGIDTKSPSGPPVLIEFVSANPTGPLHVGHARQAALGDVLANVLAVQGLDVSREFFYNDAGAQIANLALSVQARLRGIDGDSPEFPADGYRGSYIMDIARAYTAGETVGSERVPAVKATGNPDDLDAIRRFAVAYLRREQDLDLAAFGVRFDRYYLESSLYSDGLVQQVVDTMQANGHAFEQDGALWLRSTDFGDDKDRVMRKSDGTFTYFVPDVAYHTTKWDRGFRRAINVQGSDHHGTIARVRAGLQALDRGIPSDYPDYVLHTMVRVLLKGEIVKASKRTGNYVTLRDLVEWSGNGDEVRGRDAVRFFLCSRKGDTEFTFDIDLALARSNENPVYYVQYAHARICRILATSQSPDGTVDAAPAFGTVLPAVLEAAARAPLERLQSPADFALMARLSAFPEVLDEAAAELSPHPLPYYLKELAAEFHAYYDAQRVLVDDADDRAARLALLVATRQVIARGLQLLGVSAPEQM